MSKLPQRALELARELGVSDEGAATAAQLRERIDSAVSSRNLSDELAPRVLEYLCEELADADRRHDEQLDAQTFGRIVALGERWYKPSALAPAETIARYGDLLIDRFVRALTEDTRDPWRRSREMRAAFRLLDRDAIPIVDALLKRPSRYYGRDSQRILSAAIEVTIQP